MTYNTMKLDLNGVVLGALIGLGAIMILPKVAQIFGGGGHEGYGRSKLIWFESSTLCYN